VRVRGVQRVRARGAVGRLRRSDMRRTFVPIAATALAASAGSGLLLSGCAGAAQGAKPPPTQADTPVVARIEKTIPAGGIRSVRAQVKVGEARILPGTAGELQVIAVRRVRGATPEEVQRWRDQPGVTIEARGDTLVVEDLGLEPRRNGVEAQLGVGVRMPPGLSVTAHTGVGDVRVEGKVGDLEANLGVGNLRLERLECAGQRLTVESGTGDVAIDLQALPAAQLKVTVGVG